MRVKVDHLKTTYILINGKFVCQHENIEIDPPCCTTPDPDTGRISCACEGMTSVYCPDCNNEDLSGDEIEFKIGNNWVLADAR